MQPTCPKCDKPVPANEAAAYAGYHEDCTTPDSGGTSRPSAIARRRATRPAGPRAKHLTVYGNED